MRIVIDGKRYEVTYGFMDELGFGIHLMRNGEVIKSKDVNDPRPLII